MTKDVEIVLGRAWDVVLRDIKDRGLFPITYKRMMEHVRQVHENFRTEMFGMPAFVKVQDCGYQELSVKAAINPPAHWPECPDHVHQLATKSKKTDLLFFHFWKGPMTEEYSPTFSYCQGSIRTFDKILLI